MNNQFYLLVAYYEEYLAAAIALYRKFEQAFSGLELVIIDNSKAQTIRTSHPQFTVIPGDNRLSEFSGWQKGIDYLRGCERVTEDILLVFANDTANRHRYLTFLDRYLFCKTIERARSRDPNFLVGEVNRSKEPIVSAEGDFGQWVSTYLFACSGAFLRDLNFDITCGVSRESCIATIEESRIFHSSQVPEQLSQHINNWLFPAPGKHGWYKCAGTTASQKAGKSLAILCERRLSAGVSTGSFVIHDTYGGFLARKYKRQMNRLFRKFRFHLGPTCC